jgi:hypothetical protein
MMPGLREDSAIVTDTLYVASVAPVEEGACGKEHRAADVHLFKCFAVIHGAEQGRATVTHEACLRHLCHLQWLSELGVLGHAYNPLQSR